MSDVINAVKRLERAGSESSRTTKKLRDAAQAVAEYVENNIGDAIGEELPRGYRVTHCTGRGDYLQTPPQPNLDDFAPEELTYDFWHGEAPREVVLKFAADVADGWLTELADFLDARAAEAEEAAAKLEAAKPE